MQVNARCLPSCIVALAILLSSPRVAPAQGRSGGSDSASHAPDDDQRPGELLYQNLPYGSQSEYSPLTVLLNKGFDHFQARNARRDVWTFPYARAFRDGVFDVLAHPERAIEFSPGWNRWLRTEVLPLSYTHTDARWFVNYTEHLLTGGMTYRTLDEWYRVHGVPASRVAAALTTFAAAMTNEAVENPDVDRGASSSVADLYVFDVGGLLLFNWDPLVRFIGGTLQGADWENQASFTAPSGELRNTGQYYTIKIPLPRTTTRLFLRGGMGVQGGLTRRVSGDNSLTLALGADTETRHVDPQTRDESITMRFGGGVYWDKRNSLMASLNVSPSIDHITLNVFPGVLPGIGREIGTWLALTHDGHLTGGIVSRHALGSGFALGW